MLTFLFLLLTWVIFRAESFSSAINIFTAMLSGLGGYEGRQSTSVLLLLSSAFAISMFGTTSQSWALERMRPSGALAIGLAATLFALILVINDGGYTGFSILSSDRSWSWNCVFKLFLWLLIGALGIAYLFVLVIDPYNALGWSPGWERRPVDERHRYFAPGLARMARFDSAVLGNSTAMLLKPNLLNAQLGGTFVNLGMPSATPYEQLRLLDVFLDSRSTLETVLFGIDGSWCYAHEPFPAFSGVGKLNP